MVWDGTVRKSVHSNFSSIFTRFRDIATFVLDRTPLFPYPPQVSSKFPMFPWEYVDRLSATKSEGVGLIAHAISFQDFQPM